MVKSGCCAGTIPRFLRCEILSPSKFQSKQQFKATHCSQSSSSGWQKKTTVSSLTAYFMTKKTFNLLTTPTVDKNIARWVTLCLGVGVEGVIFADCEPIRGLGSAGEPMRSERLVLQSFAGGAVDRKCCPHGAHAAQRPRSPHNHPQVCTYTSPTSRLKFEDKAKRWNLRCTETHQTEPKLIGFLKK